MITLEPAWTRPKLVRYRPGAGLPVGLAGLALLALSLFAMRWVDGDGGMFGQVSRAIRSAGSARVADPLLFAYGSWGAFALAGLTAVFVLVAGVPLRPTTAGNTVPRVVGAVVAGGSAIVHALFVVDLFAGPVSPQPGAWLGVAGYLLAGAGITLGARRISATY